MNKTINVLSMIVALTLALGIQGVPISAQDSGLPPLSEPGPYDIGIQVKHFRDENRAGRSVVVHIWYPATMPEDGVPPDGYLRNADPDTSDAPYPLIIFSHYFPWPHNPPIWRVMTYYMQHLASHGYIVVLTEHANDSDPINFIDRPLDISFALDQLDEINESELAGLIDFDHVGMTGYGYGAYTTLLLGGARIDPEYYLNHCADPDTLPGPPVSEENPLSHYVIALDMCAAATNWDRATAYYEEHVQPLEEGELWPSYADERIQVVLPIAPIYTRHFGPDGLAMVTIPTLVVVGETNRWFPEQDWPFVYEHLRAEERYKLTLAHAGVGFGLALSSGFYEEDYDNIIKHFATAFFGYYLQGREDYAEYLTTENAENFNSLVEWEQGE